jgi:hypothetical protein
MSNRITYQETLVNGLTSSAGGSFYYPTTSKGSVDWPGGQGTMSVTGTFTGAGCNAILQVLGPDNVTWLTVGVDTTKTAAGVGNFALPPCQLRVAVNVPTTTSASNVWVSLGRVLV